MDKIIFNGLEYKMDIDVRYVYDVCIDVDTFPVTLSSDGEVYKCVNIIATKRSIDTPTDILLTITLDDVEYSQVGIESVEGYEQYIQQIEEHIDNNKEIYYY